MITRTPLADLETRLHAEEKGIKLHPSDKLIWLVFHNHAGPLEELGEGFFAKLTNSRISEESGLNIKTVQKAIKNLETLKIIKRIKRGKNKACPSIWEVKHL